MQILIKSDLKIVFILCNDLKHNLFMYIDIFMMTLPTIFNFSYTLCVLRVSLKNLLSCDYLCVYIYVYAFLYLCK